MRIFIIHYHLYPGGVKQTINSQVKSLTAFSDIHCTILSGYNPDDTTVLNYTNTSIKTYEKLYYLAEEDTSHDELNSKYKHIYTYLKSLISKKDIIHTHNIHLGKNPVLTYAIYNLALEGYHIINHAHDFPEDRPKNWEFLKIIIEGHFQVSLTEVLYPNINNYHFGIINSYDCDRLISYGLPKGKIMYLPNPVYFSLTEEEKKFTKESSYNAICNTLSLDSAKRIITYPVRVIRRKNIEEFILLSVLFADQFHWLVTQPPQNPVEKKYYRTWKQFCEKLNLTQIHFEVGTKVNFIQLLVASRYCISTSIREGFGMTFLEPWLFGTPVIGRNIPYVTKDFIKNNMQFPLLYNQLIINFKGEKKDFIEFSDEDKQQIISEIKHDPERKKDIISLNPELEIIFNQVNNKIIEHNKHIIQTIYSLQTYGKKLYEIYKTIIGQ